VLIGIGLLLGAGGTLIIKQKVSSIPCGDLYLSEPFRLLCYQWISESWQTRPRAEKFLWLFQAQLTHDFYGLYLCQPYCGILLSRRKLVVM